jgi:hypothetical protein
VQSDRFRPPWERGFDAFAMSAYPHVARGFGYTFRVGDASQLGYDAKRVLHDVWAPLGIDIPDEVAWVGERFMNTATWIVAYHRARPVGVMGLFDRCTIGFAFRLASTFRGLARSLGSPSFGSIEGARSW